MIQSLITNQIWQMVLLPIRLWIKIGMRATKWSQKTMCLSKVITLRLKALQTFNISSSLHIIKIKWFLHSNFFKINSKLIRLILTDSRRFLVQHNLVTIYTITPQIPISFQICSKLTRPINLILKLFNRITTQTNIWLLRIFKDNLIFNVSAPKFRT